MRRPGRSDGSPADGATARLYRENGCQLITVAVDVLAVSRTAARELASARD